MPDTATAQVFVALEGLRGSGKSTIAPMLAQAIGAEQVATFPAEYTEARAFLDWRSHDPDARAHLFVSALLVTAERVRAIMEIGSSVVIDSFTQRTVVTHRAFGAAMDLILPKDLPSPITFHLECSADERQARIRGRDKLTTWWDELADDLADRIEQEYATFPGHRIDTTNQRPEQTVQTIMTILRHSS
jgi:thymidylate kinase